MPNALATESSAYLQAHSHEAIAWQPWSEDAFAAAAAADKPVLVSIGYIACHWCHVMARESYCDPRVVAAVDRDFVAVKVDREERPDVDRMVLDALARLGARTGWPVTAFLTPAGAVFAGGSYFPPEPHSGLPGLLDTLAQAADTYRRRSPNIGIAPPSPSRTEPRDASIVADIDRYGIYLAERLSENIDAVYGGFGLSAPRFVNAAAHQLIWRHHMASGRPGFGDAVIASLRAICRSALVDHVGGGVHRYCSDDAWSVPHFEKMLYDNAQVLELLTWVWRECRCPDLRRCAEGIAAWAVNEMRMPGCGFAASLGADDPESGKEGAFYLWSESAVSDALGEETGFFLSHFAIAPLDDSERGVLLPRDDRGIPDEPKLAACLTRLAAARAVRRRPLRDGKVSADWNGLMLVALIEAGSVFERRDWLAVAREAFDEILAHLADGATLRHSLTEGRLGGIGLLDNYAMMSRAAIRLFEAFGKPRYLELAEAWVATLEEAFRDVDGGGYHIGSTEVWSPTPHPPSIMDATLPSGNALMIGVLARLHALTGQPRYAERAERLVAAFCRVITRSGIAGATAVANTQTLAQIVSIKVSGDPTLPETRELMRAALDYGLPDRLVLGPGAGNPADAGPTAQICLGTRCLLPITDVAELRALTAPGSLFASA